MATPTAVLPVPVSPVEVPTRRASQERKAALAHAIRLQVGEGACVVSQGDYHATLVKGQRTSHISA